MRILSSLVLEFGSKFGLPRAPAFLLHPLPSIVWLACSLLPKLLLTSVAVLSKELIFCISRLLCHEFSPAFRHDIAYKSNHFSLQSSPNQTVTSCRCYFNFHFQWAHVLACAWTMQLWSGHLVLTRVLTSSLPITEMVSKIVCLRLQASTKSALSGTSSTLSMRSSVQGGSGGDGFGTQSSVYPDTLCLL